MKKILYALIFLLPVLSFSQGNSAEDLSPIPSVMYSWEKPVEKSGKNITTTTLFTGSAFDMAYLEMCANTIVSSKKHTSLRVPRNEEHLILVKSGVLLISTKDSIWSVGPGSIALLMPAQRYSLRNVMNDPGNYYLMKYRSKLPADPQRGKSSGGSFVIDWKDLTFRPHDKGGIRRYFEKGTDMCKRFEMHVTTLNEGIKSHEPHTHRAEEIVLVIDNKTDMQIGDKFYKGGTGDIYYLGSNIPHAIRNDGTGTCTYFAFQFE